MKNTFRSIVAGAAMMLLANCTQAGFSRTEESSVNGQAGKSIGGALTEPNANGDSSLECHLNGYDGGAYWKAVIQISSSSGKFSQRGVLIVDRNGIQEIDLSSSDVQVQIEENSASARAVNNDQTAITEIATNGQIYKLIISLLDKELVEKLAIPMVEGLAECTGGVTTAEPPQPTDPQKYAPPTDPRQQYQDPQPAQPPTCHDQNKYPNPAPPQVKSHLPGCYYPTFPLSNLTGTECHETSAISRISNHQVVGDGVRYEFSMYNASNLTSGWVPASLGLGGERYITQQNVEIDADQKENSVDLVLSSYEPVEWRIIGNVRAVRSVHVSGYHCALVTGVDEAIVELSTYEQGDFTNPTLPLSQILAGSKSVYDGSCLPNRTFSTR